MDAIESSAQTDLSSQWILINNDMIKNIGYKTKGRTGHDRANVFRNVKKIYKKDIESKLNTIKVTNKCGSGGHTKQTLEMTQSAYDDMLLRTRMLRSKKTITEKHYIYVLHNHMFLHYGPNVYKIGYSKNIKRRLKDYTTYYIHKSKIVYSKEVTSQECETRLHKIMNAFRIKRRREFFNCPLPQVKEFIESL